MVDVDDKALELFEFDEEGGGVRSDSEIVLLPSYSSPISDGSLVLTRLIVSS